jgi:hypothetical protein
VKNCDAKGDRFHMKAPLVRLPKKGGNQMLSGQIVTQPNNAINLSVYA